MPENILNKEGFNQIKEALADLEEDLAYDPSNHQLQKLKAMLLKRLKNIKNYFIPYKDMINSPLIDKIPLDEEIIYCTNAYVHWNVKPDISQDFDHLRHAPTVKLHLKGKFYSYVFIFHTGLLLELPNFFISKGLVKSMAKYKTFPGLVTWNQISILNNGNIIIDGYIKCDLERIPDFEPESIFEFRKSKFKKEILRIRYNYTLDCLEKAKLYEAQKNYELAMNYVEDGFNSNANKSEFDLTEDLMEIRASILNKQSKFKRNIKEEILNMIVDFFNSNKGRAYTIDSIMKRFETKIETIDILDYLRENLGGILNQLIFNNEIKSKEHEGEIFYFINRES